MAHEHCCGDHDHEHEHDQEIEVVELEDENGEKEEFAILEELDFEGRHFCVMAPLAEVQALSERDEDDDEEDSNLSIEIFEVKGEDFTIVEDEALAQRLLTHLDEVSSQLEAGEEPKE